MNAPAISRPVLIFFRQIVGRYFRRHFHGVRISGAKHFTETTGPLIVYGNHSSWWDAMVAILLAAEFMPRLSHYAPMDAASLERYGILKRIGIFAVEMGTARGASQFLRTGETILKAGGVLWVTPQGEFVDVRRRPLQFKPGLTALAARAAPCVLLPLAIEYLFWDERTPECLLRFGEPIQVGATEDPVALQERAVRALESTMDVLRDMALLRESSQFETLVQGTRGPGGFYALGQRLKAWVLRRPYRVEHASPAEDDCAVRGTREHHA